MRDLYLSECRRYLRATLIFAAAHVLLQLFLGRLGSIFQQGWPMQLLILAVCMLAGLALALHQLGSYRQPSRWLWLLHRPLAPGAILAALILAAATLIAVAIGLPLLLAVLGTDFLSARTVDTRHYLAVPYLSMTSLIGWLCGAAIMSSRLRCAFLVVLLPYLMLMHAASAASLLLATLPCAALLAWNVHANFTPSRMPLAGGRGATLAQAIPLLVGMYFLLLWGTLALFHIAQVGLGQHPQTMALPPAGGYTEASRADGRSLMLAGLADGQDARAPHWRRQLPLLDVGTLQPTITRYAVRQQLSNQNAPSQAELSDQQQRLTFNHDSMRFDVHDMRTGALVDQLGLHGLGDTQPFPGVPVFAGNVLSGNMLLAFDPSGHALLQRAVLQPGEQVVAAPKKIGERLYVLSNKRLIAYAQADAAQRQVADEEVFKLPLPGPLSDLERVDIAPLLDGTLVSITGGRAMLHGAPGSTQTLLFVDADGRAQSLATRAIGHDFPLLFEHADWWLSPALHALVKLPQLAYADGTVPDMNAADALHGARPAAVWGAALLAALFSVIGAWYWRRQAGWLAACALLGLPCLLVLLVLYPRARQRRAHRSAAAAAAAAVSA